MAKSKLSVEDVEEYGLLRKRIVRGKTWWEYTDSTPGWVYKYIFQAEINDMHINPLTTDRCADWLRCECPEEAVALGLSDRLMFDCYEYVVPSYTNMSRCGVQYRDMSGVQKIALDNKNCPAGIIEYALTRCSEYVDHVSRSIPSDVFRDAKFTLWVGEYDQDLAARLGLGKVYAAKP